VTNRERWKLRVTEREVGIYTSLIIQLVLIEKRNPPKKGTVAKIVGRVIVS
jgi:hypothetical protein